MENVFERLELHQWSETHRGPRDHNEDSHATDRELGLLIIADGMGGGDRGDLAAERACSMAVELWREAAPQQRGLELVDFVIRRINTAIFELGKQESLNLGTTLTMAVLNQDEMWVGHVGDSRLYRLRGDSVELLTEDQRAAGHMLDSNIGGRDAVEPFLRRYDRQVGDILLLATDGWWSLVGDEQILASTRQHPPEDLGPALMQGRATAASDNLTLMVCWDLPASRDWWRGRAGALREELRRRPTAGGLEELGKASEHAADDLDAASVLATAWSAEHDREVVQLAVDGLGEPECTELLTQLAEVEGSVGAAVALADRVVAAARTDAASREIVWRAYRLEPREDHAYYLLCQTDAADTATFEKLAGHLLKGEPGLWFRTWTLLWEVVLKTEAGEEICRGLLAGSQQPLPGEALLGAGSRHPVDLLVDRLLNERLEERLAPLNAAFAATAQQSTKAGQDAAELGARVSRQLGQLLTRQDRLEAELGRLRESLKKHEHSLRQLEHADNELQDQQVSDAQRLRRLEQFPQEIHTAAHRLEVLESELGVMRQVINELMEKTSAVAAEQEEKKAKKRGLFSRRDRR